MRYRSFSWPVSAALAGLGLLVCGSVSFGENAVDKPILNFVVDNGDSRSRMIAVGISSLANTRVDAFDIDVHWAGIRDDPLEVMRREDSDLGLFNLAEFDSKELNLSGDLTSVMKAWRAPDQADETNDDGDPGYLLVAKQSLDAALIENFLAAVYADTIVLNAADLDTLKLAPSVAMIDLPLPLHEGAQDYLTITDATLGASSTIELETTETANYPVEQEVVTSSLARDGTDPLAASDVERARSKNDQPVQTELPGQNSGVRSYILYFGADEATTNEGHVNSVAKASQYAARFPRAKFVVSGHTNAAGSTSYNDDLAVRRASVVADTIRNDPRFRETLNVIEFEEAKPALKSKDNVAEQANHRVVITILPDQ